MDATLHNGPQERKHSLWIFRVVFAPTSRSRVPVTSVTPREPRRTTADSSATYQLNATARELRGAKRGTIGLLFLLFSLQLPFFLLSEFGLLLLFPFALVAFSLVSHVTFSSILLSRPFGGRQPATRTRVSTAKRYL